jgi:chromosome partitioning protein
MKTITLAATKGGVGKSTLASAFAVAAAADRGMVGMLDQDPQASLTGWWARRGEVDNPRIYSGASTIAEAVDSLSQHGVDWLIIDTGPGLLRAIEPAIIAADLIVVPIKPSAFDLEAVDPILEVVVELRKTYLMVLNEIDPRAPKMAVSAREYLQDSGHMVAVQTIAQRMPYRAALTLGKSGPEVERDGKCAEEIRSLWAEVKALAARTTATKRVRHV